MSIYYVAYSTTADGYVSVANATYSTARASTAATTTSSGSGVVENSSGYSISQVFCVYDTSALPAGGGSGSFSFSQFFQGNANADKVRIHEVSSVANKIAGTALAGLTLHSDPNTFPTVDGRYAAAISSVAALPRSATFSVVVHTLGEENGTTPTGVNKFSPTLADTAGTTDDPFLSVTTGIPWIFVGTSTTVEATATPLTLTEPAGVSDGDLLVATISSRSTATTAPTATGWTAVGSQATNNTLTTGSAIGSGAMLYRVRSGAPSLAFTLPATVSVAQGRITAYRGNAATTPLDASTAVTASAGTAVSVTGLTTTQDDDLIVAMTAGGQEATWANFAAVTAPTGASGAVDTTSAPSPTAWIKRAETITTSGADTSLGVYDAVKTAAGATGNLTVTASISAGHVVVAGAFKFSSDPIRYIAQSVNAYVASRVNCVVTAPAGIQDNDILIAMTGSTVAVTAPAGFTAFSGSPRTVGGAQTSIWWKRAASESGSYTFTHATGGSVGAIFVYRGCITSGSPIDVSSVAGGSGTAVTATGVTTTINKDILLYAMGRELTAGAINPPTGMDERLDTYIYLADVQVPTAGATGNKTQTIDSSQNWGVWLAALKPVVVSANKSITAVGGSYALTGTAATPKWNNLVTATDGAYALTGTAATLTKGTAPTAYNLPAVAGSYAMTGTAASLYHGWKVAAVAGSYALTGAAATLKHGWKPVAAAGAYALTGTTANLMLGREALALSGSYALTGTTAAFRRTYNTVAVAGSYSLTGTPANLLKVGAKAIIGLPGSYTLTGVAATLTKVTNRVVTAVPGSYSLTGASAALLRADRLSAVSGSYALSGAAALIKHGWKTAAVAGSYALTGTATAFRRTWQATAVSGAYTLTGTAATFRRTWKATAVSGSYALTGVPVNLLKPGAYAIIGLPGAYALTGQATSLEYGREVLALSGSYALTGVATSLEKGREIAADPGSYALTGTPATLSKIGVSKAIVADPGFYTLTGQPVSLIYSGSVTVTPPGTPYWGPSGGRIPSKELKKAIRELLARERKKPKKKKKRPAEIAKELVAGIAALAPAGLGALEKKELAAFIRPLLSEIFPDHFVPETIHDRRAIEDALLALQLQAIEHLRQAAEEEDEEAVMLLLTAA